MAPLYKLVDETDTPSNEHNRGIISQFLETYKARSTTQNTTFQEKHSEDLETKQQDLFEKLEHDLKSIVAAF